MTFRTLLFFIFLPTLSFSETLYRTISSGDWDQSSIWESVEVDGLGEPTGAPPTPIPSNYYPCFIDPLDSNPSIVEVRHQVSIKGLHLACRSLKVKYQATALSGSGAEVLMLANSEGQAPYVKVLGGFPDGLNDSPVIYNESGEYGGNGSEFIIEGYPPGPISPGIAQPAFHVLNGYLEAIRGDVELMGKLSIGSSGKVHIKRDLQILGDSANLSINGNCALRIGDDLHAFCIAIILGNGLDNVIRTNQNPGSDGSPSTGLTLQQPGFTFELEEIANGVTRYLLPGMSADGLITNVTFSNDICPFADLQLSKSVNKTEVSPGETMTYTIYVDNNGNVPIDSFKVQDILPSQLELIEAEPATEYVDGIWTHSSTILPGNSAELTLKVRVKQTTCSRSITNTASLVEYVYNGVTSTQDEVSLNNSSSVGVSVSGLSQQFINITTMVEPINITTSQVTVNLANESLENYPSLSVYLSYPPFSNMNPVDPQTISLDAQSTEQVTFLSTRTTYGATVVPAYISLSSSNPKLCNSHKKAIKIPFKGLEIREIDKRKMKKRYNKLLKTKSLRSLKK